MDETLLRLILKHETDRTVPSDFIHWAIDQLHPDCSCENLLILSSLSLDNGTSPDEVAGYFLLALDELGIPLPSNTELMKSGSLLWCQDYLKGTLRESSLLFNIHSFYINPEDLDLFHGIWLDLVNHIWEMYGETDLIADSLSRHRNFEEYIAVCARQYLALRTLNIDYDSLHKSFCLQCNTLEFPIQTAKHLSIPEKVSRFLTRSPKTQETWIPACKTCNNTQIYPMSDRNGRRVWFENYRVDI